MKRSYKATFILDIRNQQDSVDTIVERVKSTIESIDAEVSNVNNLGQKDFARITDRKFPAGTYVSFDFQGPAESAATLQEKFRLDKTVNRILVESN